MSRLVVEVETFEGDPDHFFDETAAVIPDAGHHGERMPQKIPERLAPEPDTRLNVLHRPPSRRLPLVHG